MSVNRALSDLIEQAIEVAARLGPDAFDFVEGRGLAEMRTELHLRVDRIAARHSAAVRKNANYKRAIRQLQKAYAACWAHRELLVQRNHELVELRKEHARR